MRQNYLFLTICILTSFIFSTSGAENTAVSGKKAKTRRPAQANVSKPGSSVDDIDLDAPTEMPKPLEMPRKTDLSMADTIKLAVKGNPTLRTANLNYESSTNSYSLRTFQFYFPTGTVSGSYSDASTVDSTSDAAAAAADASPYTTETKTKTDTFGLSFAGALPWVGLQYTLSPYTVTHTRTDIRAEGTAGDSYSAGLTSSFSFALLKNFGPLASSIAREREEIDFLSARLSRDGTYVATLNDIRTSYWDLLFQIKNLQIQREALIASIEVVNETRTKIKSGLNPQIELYGALSNYYSSQSNLLKAEQDLRSAQERFKRQLGMDESNKDEWYVPADEGALLDVPPPENDVDKTYKLALEKRQDYQAALKALQSSRLSQSLARNGMLPGLDLTLETGNTGTDPQSRGGAYTNATQANKYNVTYGARLSWNFPWVEAETNLKNAVISTMISEISIQQQRQQIKESITATLVNLDASYRRIRVAKLAALAGQKKYDAETIKYKLGESSQKNLIDYQRDLRTARLSELEAYISYRKALIALDSALGVIKNQ